MFSVSRVVYLFALCSLLLLPAVPALADALPGPKVTVEATGVADADFEDDKGSASVVTSAIDVDWLFFSLGYELRSYNFDNTAQLPFGAGSDDPWDELHRIRFGARYFDDLTDTVGEGWGYQVGASLTSSFEKEMDDSYGGSLRLIGTYDVNDDVTVGLGVGLFANALDVRVLPLPYVGYRRFAESGVYARIGLPTEVGYRFEEAPLTLRAELSRDSRLYRLADDNPSVREGYLQTSHFQLLVAADWEPIDDLTLTAGPVVQFARDVEVRDDDGDERHDSDQDAAFGAHAKLKYRF